MAQQPVDPNMTTSGKIMQPVAPTQAPLTREQLQTAVNQKRADFWAQRRGGLQGTNKVQEINNKFNQMRAMRPAQGAVQNVPQPTIAERPQTSPPTQANIPKMGVFQAQPGPPPVIQPTPAQQEEAAFRAAYTPPAAVTAGNQLTPEQKATLEQRIAKESAMRSGQ